MAAAAAAATAAVIFLDVPSAERRNVEHGGDVKIDHGFIAVQIASSGEQLYANLIANRTLIVVLLPEINGIPASSAFSLLSTQVANGVEWELKALPHSQIN